MTRYILIDNHSGYIFADSADLNGTIWTGDNPADFAAAFDVTIGEHGRTYEAISRSALASNETGYHVYRADINGSEAVTVIEYGQDQDMIDAVERDCEYVTTLRIDDADAIEQLTA
jgi:hypothetical protein